MEKGNRDKQPPPISLIRQIQKIAEAKRIHGGELSDDILEKIQSELEEEEIGGLEQEKESFTNRFIQKHPRYGLVYTREAIQQLLKNPPPDIVRGLAEEYRKLKQEKQWIEIAVIDQSYSFITKRKLKVEKHRIEIEHFEQVLREFYIQLYFEVVHAVYVADNEGRFNEKQKKCLKKLEVCLKKLAKLHGRAKAEIETNRDYCSLKEESLGTILKAVRLGLRDHPFVSNWIQALHALGCRKDLRRAKKGLEKGVVRPMHGIYLKNILKDPEKLAAIPRKNKEVNLFVRVCDLHEKGLSWRSIHRKVVSEKLYSGTIQSFDEWLLTHKLK